jgi:hypothetical protein
MARSSWRNSGLTAAFAVALVVATSGKASAHRLDEYLQAAQLAIDPDRVELQLELTPGAALAAAILAEIDRDRNGTISDAEARAYAAVVQGAIRLELDGSVLHPELVESRPPAVDAVSKGEGTLRLRWTAPLPPLADGPHELFYMNAHHRDVGVYLANVLVPSTDRVAVTSQDRDVEQREYTVAYELKGGPAGALRGLAIAGIAGALAGAVFFLRRRRA